MARDERNEAGQCNLAVSSLSLVSNKAEPRYAEGSNFLFLAFNITDGTIGLEGQRSLLTLARRAADPHQPYVGLRCELLAESAGVGEAAVRQLRDNVMPEKNGT